MSSHPLHDAPVLVLFRDDIRIDDNPALSAAIATGHPVACIYLHNETTKHLRRMGAATRWWLHGALTGLHATLEKLGGKLVVFSSSDIRIAAIVQAINPQAVFWNRRYGQAERDADASLKQHLVGDGIEAKSFNGTLLYEPWEVKTTAGTSMKVYSPFWRSAEKLHPPRPPSPGPARIRGFQWDSATLKHAVSVDDLELLPRKPDWAGGLRQTWKPTESGALETLERFLDHGIDRYADKRNNPDRPATSRLSPYLRFGQISPRRIWQSVSTSYESGQSKASPKDIEVFRKELGWREFSYHLLFHHPNLASVNFQPKFDAFPWRVDEKSLKAWQQGQTGYPLVDAGMRQLWQTGWMHNRVRMVTASFLIKHLLIDWRQGEDWFWDTLVDADAANNAASWQWVAGSGADAAPYYRIFNPVLQGEKFDAQGRYVREFVPELAKLPNEFIHKPWMAPKGMLMEAGIKLGIDYPEPIVDHAAARERALAALKYTSRDETDRR